MTAAVKRVRLGPTKSLSMQSIVELAAHGTAVLSGCERYRYYLTRQMREQRLGLVVFVLCNPSTADALQDDATVRKCMGFTRRWGRRDLHIYNAFALRSPNPKQLLRDADPFGPDNGAWLRNAFTELGSSAERPILVLGWGEALPVPLRKRTIGLMAKLAIEFDVHPKCLGLTKSGQPRHPLMPSYETELQDVAMLGFGQVGSA